MVVHPVNVEIAELAGRIEGEHWLRRGHAECSTLPGDSRPVRGTALVTAATKCIPQAVGPNEIA
jgi:hypothetical protein